ncbi:MAG TPA: hypothetical protein VF547_04960 [Allosphingosinicella sp.]|jgi:hypothetical protein
MESSESRLAPSPEPASDDSVSPRNLEPALDRLDFETVPLRRRVDGLTPEKQRRYVEALADSGIAREAAARVGLSEQAINRVRRRADARSFDDACEAAQLFGARRLRSIAYERAIEGTLKGHYYRGERVGEERVYDNRLLIYLLGKTEHLLRQEERKSQAICEDWEPRMDALEQGLEPPGPAAPAPELSETGWGSPVWEDEETGILFTTFPPPEGFEGEEQGVWDGIQWYCRTLTPDEQAVMDAGDAEEMAALRAEECARRDRFFGFAGDGISAPGEAETNETSKALEEAEETSAEGALEFKSTVPPSPTAGWDRAPSPAGRPGEPKAMHSEVRGPPASAGPGSNPE